jgi:hypothetical protein
LYSVSLLSKPGLSASQPGWPLSIQYSTSFICTNKTGKQPCLHPWDAEAARKAAKALKQYNG